MDEKPQSSGKLLPENAYRKLAPGESYRPIVPAEDRRPEVTRWSIGMGLLMVVIFTAACVYMALRAGNAIEASIPIAILAIFFGRVRSPASTILENVMVQSVGQAAGVVAAGASFVIPAIYINDKVGTAQEGLLHVAWWQIFLACFIGGVLGTVLIIPIRRYFVKDQHGELPFPEATAINEILVTGESQGTGAGKILLIAFGLGALFDFSVEALALWNANLTSSMLPFGMGEALAGVRLELKITALASLFGLGYIIGLKYSAIIAAGSVLSCLVLVPLIYLIGKDAPPLAYAGTSYPIGSMGAGALFASLVKPLGIGAIAVSGLIGILRMGKIVASSVSLGFKGFSKKAQASETPERTQLDLSPRTVVLIELGSMLAMGALFVVVALISKAGPGEEPYSLGQCLLFGLVGMLAGFVLSFLFTPVAAQAIAIVGTNPVSGMTLITIVLAIGAMLLVGLRGTAGMVIALIIGTAVCTALSTSGALITDFKIGYWIGSTPRNQQRYKFLGMLVAALVVAFVIPLMDSSYHFAVPNPAGAGWISNENVLPAPQANMLAAVSRGMMNDPANQPWLLYGLGGLIAILLFLAGVPMLAFALGMYLPLGINLALLAGAFCGWLVARTGKTPEERKRREEQGPLIASGLMAGAAIFGIITALLRLPALGAPIQYISVGKDYKVEAVVDGRALCGVSSCSDLPAEQAERCNPNLREIVQAEDEKCRTFWICSKAADGKIVESREVREDELDTACPAGWVREPKLAHPWYEEGTGQGLGLLLYLALGFLCFGLAKLGSRWSRPAGPPVA